MKAFTVFMKKECSSQIPELTLIMVLVVVERHSAFGWILV